MRIAMLTPLKDPDHPEPSGDREVARLLRRALAEGGFEVAVPTRLRMLDRSGDAAFTAALAAQASQEADAWCGTVEKGREPRPDAVFTYHVYYKAPDVAGPRIARRLGVPYVVAEGSRAPRRAGGRWREGHRLAEAALDTAAAVLVLNEKDREVLARAAPAGQKLPAFPPFVDPAGWPTCPRAARGAKDPLRLLTVAMMRRGDKLASYGRLAAAFAAAPDDTTLDIVGDGPARPDVEGLFAPFASRARFHGLVADRNALAARYAAADLLVWPAVNEAFGMVFLEAALQGCPALAGASGGVPGVVKDRVTGILVPEDDAGAFAAALRDAAARRDDLARMGVQARRFVLEERSLVGAAARLRAILEDVVRGGAR